jgi:hypothetical protein
MLSGSSGFVVSVGRFLFAISNVLRIRYEMYCTILRIAPITSYSQADVGQDCGIYNLEGDALVVSGIGSHESPLLSITKTVTYDDLFANCCSRFSSIYETAGC